MGIPHRPAPLLNFREPPHPHSTLPLFFLSPMSPFLLANPSSQPPPPVPEDPPGYHPTPESSPELTKRSWFGSLLSTEKDESYTVVVKGKALASIKADLIHAFLSVSDLQHSVLSPVSFRLEYKRGSTAPAMFQRQVKTCLIKHNQLSQPKPKTNIKHKKTNISKVGFANHCTHKLTCCVQVRMQVDLSPVAASETPAGCLHAITFTLISGNIRRFRRICEHIQSMVRSPH